jgi:hypothetical protein
VRQRDKSRIPLFQSAYKYISPECSSSTLRFQPLTSSLSGGDPDEQTYDPNQQEPSPGATSSLHLRIHPSQDNGNQLQHPCGLFHLHPLLLQFLLPLQVHIVGDFLSLFLCSFDPLNLGIMQQISHPNQSATPSMFRSNGQPRSNPLDQCRD